MEFEQSDLQLACRSNPFHNELVLQNLFKFFKANDLKNFRLVSRSWCRQASSYLQDCSFVKLNENIHNIEAVKLKAFRGDFSNVPPDKIFFRNYHLSLWTIDVRIPEMYEFFQQFGPSMRNLEISWAKLVSAETLRSIMFKIAPNLKQLKLKDCAFYDALDPNVVVATKVPIHAGIGPNDVTVHSNVTSFSFFGGEPSTLPPLMWEEMLLGYPRLTHLQLYNINHTETLDVMAAIQKIRKKDSSVLNINKLNIFNGDYATTRVPSNALSALMELKLPLTHLNIDIGVNCNESLLSQLLEQYSKVLIRLTIYRGPLGVPMVNFPFDINFPKLERLEITETVSDTFSLIQYMPNLRQLSVCEPPEVEPPLLPTDMIFKTSYDFPNASLPVNLHTLHVDYDCSYGDVRKLVHWFPNVKSVRIHLDNESFRTVCGEWKNVEELDILGDKVNDEGITGLKLKTENGVDIRIQNPLNITTLKHLRVLRMKNYGLSTRISDLSVFYGFTKVPTLKTLEVCSRYITETGWSTLNELESLQTLIPTDGRWQCACLHWKKGV